ncbi:Amino acid-binding ACT domain protein [Sphingobium herbicidovorans NBRC 16415]|uniref:Amino acid-binding ACT domain protein n=1 Tax=Sphingobium herbicidovorans (strain ATCC 700291 / DSM 11019 / CCUG 56400 / KCTC 2939 / LMG 18315 / NBRC 16415 / MH) TaxID=1219045 RepID=A0A086PBT3_SPHHM|nr:Amino acid-binding ACT domain protein [Sphingobium herbicidovorans NBRC 16415]
MDRAVILTVVGSDRPGLTRAIAEAVYAAGGNWLESHLSRLGGKYVGSVLVELPEDRLHELEAAVRGIDAMGIKIDIIAAADAEERSGLSLAIEIVGQDRPGIVREVTSALAKLDVNIDDFLTRIERSAWSGAPLFRANVQIALPTGLSTDEVREALEAISGEIMVDFLPEPTLS